MGILNSRALGGGTRALGGNRPGVARTASLSAQRVLQSRLNIHGLPGVHVPAGLVEIPTGTHAVGDHYLMNPVTKGLVKEWVRTDGRTPFVRLAMETARSPYNPGLLHVVQRGVDALNMEFIAEAEMIADDDLDADQGHLELVGKPIDVLTYLARIIQGEPGDVMAGLGFFEQVALASFLNRVTIEERSAAHLGAFNMVSEAQIVHAASHPKLFEGAERLPGMPGFVEHWTRDLYESSQLDLSAYDRIYARRVRLGGLHYIDGPLPVIFRSHSSGSNLCHPSDNYVARFAVLPAPQDSTTP